MPGYSYVKLDPSMLAKQSPEARANALDGWQAKLSEAQARGAGPHEIGEIEDAINALLQASKSALSP